MNRHFSNIVQPSIFFGENLFKYCVLKEGDNYHKNKGAEWIRKKEEIFVLPTITTLTKTFGVSGNVF